MKNLIIFCLFFSLNSALAYNVNESGIVKGSVYNPENNSAVKLVNVSLKNVVDNTISEVVTNENGDFILRNLPFGEYVLTTKLEGYEMKTIYNVVLMRENPIAKVSRIGLNELKESKKGIVMGYILDSTNDKPIKYAAITVYNSLDDSLTGIGITNEKGEFKIDDLPFGEYCIQASFSGFLNKKIYNVVLMRPNPIVNLEKIELTREKTNTPLDLIF